ncbi:MAG: hypothetical protein HUU54_12770 [Ignavibacteriaceae bacterium]|nr:hypothetical protein [Ignavibacteriaceae bacterium]
MKFLLFLNPARVPTFIISLVILLSGLLFPQSAVDSLEIYDPFSQTNEVRRIIKAEFTIFGKEFSREIRLHEFTIKKYTGVNNDSAGNAHISLGDIYFKSAFYKKALESYFEALKAFESARDSEKIALVNLKLGRAYYFADMNEHSTHFHTARDIYKKLNNEASSAMFYYISAFLEADPARKKQYNEKALEIQQALVKKHPGKNEYLERYGTFLNALGRYEEAISIAAKINNTWLEVLYLNNYGHLLAGEGNHKKALEIFKLSLVLSKEGRYKTLLRNAYENIARVYRLSGDWVNSNYYIQQMNLVSESLYLEQLATQASEMEIKYESAKKDLENMSLRREKKTYSDNFYIQRNINILLFFSVFAVSAVLLLVYIGNRKLKKINNELDKSNAEILAQQSELKRLYNELLESEQKLKYAQATAHLANWEYDYSTKELKFSDEFPVIFDLPKENLFSNGFDLISRTICFKSDSIRLNSFVGLYGQPDKETVTEFRIISESGAKWIKINKSVTKNEAGTAVKSAGTVQDITELKLEEENKIKIAEQKSYTNELIKYQEEERKRLAGELHDGLGQDLLLIKNRALLALQNKGVDESSRNQLEEINNSVSDILDSVRALTFNLRPLHIERLGLASVVGTAIEKLSGVSSIRFTCDIDNVEGVFGAEEEITIYRIIQEALNNIIKHSGAESAEIRLQNEKQMITLYITDNGRGFDLEKTLHSSGGFGLRNIISRVEMLRGSINIVTEFNKGTSLNISIPS